MTTAILDTNVVIQSVIGSPIAASARTLDALLDGRFQLAYSPALVDEWLEVLALPHIRKRHGMSDDELLELLASLIVNGAWYFGKARVPATLTRDLTDTKFLALAAEAHADYLVTNDRRHLLPLRRFHVTRIVTPAHFMAQLS